MPLFPVVQRTPVGSSTGSANVTLTFPGVATVGHLIVVPIICRAGLGSEDVTVADDAGNTYTLKKGSNANDNKAILAYAYNIAAPGTPITVTVHPLGSSQQTMARAIEHSGFGAADPIVGFGSSTGNSTGPNTSMGDPGVSDVLLYGLFANFRLNFNITSITVQAVVPAWTEEFEKLSSVFGTLTGEADEREITGAAGAQAISWTVNTGINWSAVIVGFYGTPPTALIQMHQLARETLETDGGVVSCSLHQYAREVLYPFTCSAPPPPGTTGCPEGLPPAPVVGRPGCTAGL